MARVSLDSNLLIYAALEPQTDKGRRAQAIIAMCAPRGVLSHQALLEFVAVVRRRAPDLVDRAVAQADAWAQTFETAPTSDRVFAEALQLVRQHRFQVWDAVIWASARYAGATILLSEDMQDGFTKDGLTVRNPFALDDAALKTLVEG